MPFLLSGKSWHIILPVKQHYSLSCLSEHSHILIKKKSNQSSSGSPLLFFFFFFLCGETRSREFACRQKFRNQGLTGASNHGCVFPSVCASCVCVCARMCVCVWSYCCCCCCCYHLPPSPPVSGLINKTASAAPSDPLPGSLSSSDQILMCDTELAH